MPKIIIKSPARIAGDAYSVSQIIGKTLYAKVDVNYYSNLPSSGGKKLGVVKAGNPAGTVYSWVQDKSTKAIWWQFQNDDGSFYYIEHQPDRFNVQNLQQQGALSAAQQIEEQKKKDEQQANDDKPWYEKLADGLGSTAKTGLWIIGGAIVVSTLLKNR